MIDYGLSNAIFEPPNHVFAYGENEFDQNVLTFHNNFRTEYEQQLKAHNGGQCVMVLIKNVTTSKWNWYLKAQHYTILTKVVSEATQTHCL